MQPLLALDLSTKTGYAYFENGTLSDVGTFTHKVHNYVSNIKSYNDIPSQYPWNIMATAHLISVDCVNLAARFNYPNIVIEHTEGSSHRISQRTLEFIHYCVLSQLSTHSKYCVAPNKIKYLLNSDWRRIAKCYISQWPDMVKLNKEIAKIKKKVKPTRSGAKVAKINGKIVGKWNAKKLSLYIAKLHNPQLADLITTDDISDAVLLGEAALALNLFEEDNE